MFCKNICCKKTKDIIYCVGPTGATGPRGLRGETGRGLQISGVVDTIEELPLNPQNGDAYLVGNSNPKNLYVFDSLKNTWVNAGPIQGEDGEDGVSDTIEVGLTTSVEAEMPAKVVDRTGGNHHILDFSIPKGATGAQGIQGMQGIKGDKGDIGPVGPQGATGPSLIKEVYIATVRDPSIVVPDTGLVIPSGGRLPLKTLQTSSGTNIVQLNANENTIQFNELGTYEIIFTFNGNVRQPDFPFDINTDFLSVGFRAVDADEVYIGVNDWSYNEVPHNVMGIGMLQITDYATAYELVNLQVKDMVVLGGHKDSTLTNSYFTTPMVTMLIKKLN